MNIDVRNFPSHRDLLSLGAAAGAVAFLQAPEIARAAEYRHRPEPREINVRAFGAAGNGSTDDMAPFQRALDHAHNSGAELCMGPPENICLRETWRFREA